jgi:hypothetical protein
MKIIPYPTAASFNKQSGCGAVDCFQINKVVVMEDSPPETGRRGMALFVRYLIQVNVYKSISAPLWRKRENAIDSYKGLQQYSPFYCHY